jgi:hypothetical protein
MDGPRLTLALVEAQVAATRRERPLEVRVRWLQHESDVLRLYVIHEAES